MGGKPSRLLPGTADNQSALWQGGKKPLGDAAGGFFDEQFIGAAVSLGFACVDPAKHPAVDRRLRLPVADEPGAAAALRERLEEAVRFLHAARLDGLNCYVHCARGVSRSSAITLAYILAYLPETLPTTAIATQWQEAQRPQALPNAGFARMLAEWVRSGGRDGCAAALRELDAAHPEAAAKLRAADAAAVAVALAAAAPDSPEAARTRKWMSVVKGVRASRATNAVVLDSRKGLDDVAARAKSDAEDLWIDRNVRRVELADLSPFCFLRDYVAASRPVILRLGGDAAAVDAFFEAEDVRVSATPDGRADAISRTHSDGRPRLACPEVRRGKPTVVDETREDVLYVSDQDGSLAQFPSLAKKVAERKDWPLPPAYLQAFAESGAAKPDAVNVWYGGAASVTSAHQDRAFENLYLVLKGAKRFLLLPPTAPAWLPSKPCVLARWTKSSGSWALVDDQPEQLVDWLDVPSLADTEPRPAVADVRPGDLLYLPAGWVHEVHQALGTLAVNWWFETRCHGARWCGAELARRVGELRSVAS